MRAVYQTRFGPKVGNCMQAAAASMLELPLESVPDFGNMPGDPYARMRKFFEAFGFELDERPRTEVPPGFYFQTGTSTHGHEHMVIARAGKLVHDPNQYGAGLVELHTVQRIKPITEGAKELVRYAADQAPTQAEAELRPIQPNAGTQMWYRDVLQDLARRMAADILRKLEKCYRPASDRLALDDDPIVTLRTVMRVWGRLWQKRFDDLAKEIAASFAGRTARYTDATLRRRMREAGFTVRFRPTERQVSAFRAVVAENVGLIKSIPQQFHKQVEGAVWRAVAKGGAMGELSREIRKRYGTTYRRAALIARDQVAKSKSTLENARRAELGIREATWIHSHAGREPRPTHVKMNGKRYDIAKGMWDSDEQKWVQPGELINCRCTSRAVIPARLSPTKGRN